MNEEAEEPSDEPATVSTVTSGTCGDDLTWVLDDEGTLTISGSGDMTAWTKMGEVDWDDYDDYIVNVIIEDGVTNIGPYAFANCYNFISVEISSTVTSIEGYAFYWCYNLLSINIPDSVTSIDMYAFMSCNSLTSINISDGITSIGDHAFYGSESLSVIYFSANIASIGAYAFTSCSSLTDVYYAGSEEEWLYVNIGSGNTPLKSATMHYNSTYSEVEYKNICGDNLTWSIDDGVLTLSGTGDMYDWSTLDEVPWAEYAEDITSVVIEEGVTSIGDNAFNGYTSITSVTIADTVTSIGDSSFMGCTGLTSIEIPDSVTTIGEYAFALTGLNTVLLGSGIESIADNAFYGCSDLIYAYYDGTDEEWESVIIGDNNDCLTNVIHTNDEDYYWIFEEDNFCFTNYSGYFGKGSYYIEDEMFYSLLDTLNDTQIKRMAFEFGKITDSDEETQYTNFLNNNLKSWCGSCYGMSVIASLIKVGTLSALDFGATSTYGIEALNSKENSTMESIINLYQITEQAIDGNANTESQDMELILTQMWILADEVGEGGEPFIVYLKDSQTREAHAVVCYGAESGKFSVGTLWWTEEYTMRLLVYDPNSTEEQYIYIGENFSSAYTTCNNYVEDEFDIFGFYANYSNVSADYLDVVSHYIYLDVYIDAAPTYTIYAPDGSYVTISNVVITEGTLDASIYQDAAVLADGEVITDENELYTVYLPADSDYYTIVPSDGEFFDGLLTFDDFSVIISGHADSATIYADGTIDIKEASDDLTVDITVNDSAFDYVTISGTASGDVTIQVSNENIEVTGAISDYIVEDMDNSCNTTSICVGEDTDSMAYMENGSVVVYADLDEDGTYEEAITSEHSYGEPVYTWADDYSSCTVTFACSVCGNEETVEADGISSEDADGTITYTANFTFYGEEYSEAITATEELISLTNATITLSKTSYTFDGTAKKPTVTVTDGTTTLVEGTDYTVTYSNNVYVGTATVTITGIGNYTGTISTTFQITSSSSSSGTGTVKNGLTLDSDGIYRYYQNDVFAGTFAGVVEYDGGYFFVANGVLCSDANGLNLFDDTWYFLANGQVQTQHTGFALYDGEWFYITNGILDVNVNGLMSYDGEKFLFAEGRLLLSYNGLWLNSTEIGGDDQWYFIGAGMVQNVSQVVMYDGAWFVVENGVLDSDYNGTIEYDGATFKVVAGQLY